MKKYRFYRLTFELILEFITRQLYHYAPMSHFAPRYANCYMIFIEKNESYMIRVFEEKGFRIECKSESFKSWSQNPSEHSYISKINKRVILHNVKYQLYYKKNSFSYILKDLTKVCSSLHSKPYFEYVHSEEPTFSACLRA